MFVVCEKWVETRIDCYIDPSSSSPIAALLSNLGLGCSNVGHWGSLSPLSASWFSRGHPVSSWLKPSGYLVILFSNVQLLPLFFRLFTQVHLLIDGSVEGQYITIIPFLFFKIPHVDIFFMSLFHPPHTHILQIMLKDNNSKNTKRNYLNNSKIQKSLLEGDLLTI